ncbi:biopolymer transporter ExbD [Verrucomicrobiales bacterium]|jgi:biopolymer transport protein ExbD|nr:biopolymer transporter ExbD [Verrucomicrobiales bacterium]
MIRRKKADGEVAFNITPMIDMTFLLLIFFMVTQRITEQQINVPITLPIAISSVKPSKVERDIVNIDGVGNYYIGDRPATKDELMAHLRIKFKDYPPLQIYLRADKNTPTKKIREFMDMAAEVGALDVIFGTYAK